MFDWHFDPSSKTTEDLLSCTVADLKRQTEKQPLQAVHVPGVLKCWGTWDATCRYKAKDITPSIVLGERGEEERQWSMIYSENMSVMAASRLLQRHHRGKFLRDGMEPIWVSRACTYHETDRTRVTQTVMTIIKARSMTKRNNCISMFKKVTIPSSKQLLSGMLI